VTTTTARSDEATRTRLDYRPARCRSKLHLQTPVDHTFRIFVDVPHDATTDTERPQTGADRPAGSRTADSRRNRRLPRASAVNDRTAGPAIGDNGGWICGGALCTGAQAPPPCQPSTLKSRPSSPFRYGLRESVCGVTFARRLSTLLYRHQLSDGEPGQQKPVGYTRLAGSGVSRIDIKNRSSGVIMNFL